MGAVLEAARAAFGHFCGHWRRRTIMHSSLWRAAMLFWNGGVLTVETASGEKRREVVSIEFPAPPNGTTVIGMRAVATLESLTSSAARSSGAASSSGTPVSTSTSGSGTSGSASRAAKRPRASQGDAVFNERDHVTYRTVADERTDYTFKVTKVASDDKLELILVDTTRRPFLIQVPPPLDLHALPNRPRRSPGRGSES